MDWRGGPVLSLERCLKDWRGGRVLSLERRLEDWRWGRVLSLERRLQYWTGRRVLSLEHRLKDWGAPGPEPGAPPTGGRPRALPGRRAQAALRAYTRPSGSSSGKPRGGAGRGVFLGAQPLGLGARDHAPALALGD